MSPSAILEQWDIEYIEESYIDDIIKKDDEYYTLQKSDNGKKILNSLEKLAKKYSTKSIIDQTNKKIKKELGSDFDELYTTYDGINLKIMNSSSTNINIDVVTINQDLFFTNTIEILLTNFAKELKQNCKNQIKDCGYADDTAGMWIELK